MKQELEFTARGFFTLDYGLINSVRNIKYLASKFIILMSGYATNRYPCAMSQLIIKIENN